MPPKLTNEIINAAILGFEEQKRRIDGNIAEIRAMLSGAPVEAAGGFAATTPTGRTRRKVSAAARKKMAEGQRKRWAAIKGEAAPATTTVTPKRKLSAAGRANIIAALKKRWAAKNAAAKAKK